MDFFDFFDQTACALEKKLEDKTTGRRLLAYETAKLGRRLFAQEKPVVWVNVSVPFEILNAFDIETTYSEFVGAVLSGAGMAAPFIEQAEAAGYSTDICSYHRALLGASMAQIVPKPVAALATTCPCDGGLKAVGEVGRFAGAPTLYLNVPAKATESAVSYLAKQLENMAAFLSEHTGQPFDLDRLSAAIEKSNRTTEALKTLYAYGERRPAPYNHKDLKNFQIMMLPLMGTDAGRPIVEALINDFEIRVSKGQPGIPNERIRLLWIQNRIQFANELLDRLAEDYGANIVWDELNDVYWEPIDPAKPFTGLARRLINNPLGGDIHRRLQAIRQGAVRYGIHGAVHPCHWGCRQSLNARSLFAQALEEVGVPMITLDVDCVDKRSFAPGQLLTRLEAFCEMF